MQFVIINVTIKLINTFSSKLLNLIYITSLLIECV